MKTDVDPKKVREWLWGRLLMSLLWSFVPIMFLGIAAGAYFAIEIYSIGQLAWLSLLSMGTLISAHFVLEAVTERYRSYDRWCEYMSTDLHATDMRIFANGVKHDYREAHAPQVQDA